jgi:hypothetical protein
VSRLVQKQWKTFTLPVDENLHPLHVPALLDQPGAKTPRVVSDYGTFSYKADGTLELGVRGHFQDAVYLPEKKATVLVPLGTDDEFVFRSVE